MNIWSQMQTLFKIFDFFFIKKSFPRSLFLLASDLNLRRIIADTRYYAAKPFNLTDIKTNKLKNLLKTVIQFHHLPNRKAYDNNKLFIELICVLKIKTD